MALRQMSALLRPLHQAMAAGAGVVAAGAAAAIAVRVLKAPGTTRLPAQSSK